MGARRRRLTAFLTCVALVAAACGDDEPDSGASDSESAPATESASSDSSSSAAPSSEAGTDTAGSDTSGSSTAPSSEPAVEGAGVSDSTIKIGFAYQRDSCGNSQIESVEQGLGIDTGGATAIEGMVKVLNENPALVLGLDQAAADELAAAGPGIWGRTFEVTVYDDGGPDCEDKGRAMAAAAVEEDDIFAMVQDGSYPPFGSEPWVSEEITSRGRIHIGIGNGTQAYFDARAPYQFEGFTPQVDRAVVSVASYMCSLVGQQFDGTDRVFGLIAHDNPEDQAMVDAFTPAFEACGGSLAVTARVSDDPAQADQQIGPALTRMIEEGVTTIFPTVDILDMLSITTQATAQSYMPEWIVSDAGGLTYPARVFYLWDAAQRDHITAVSFRYGANPVPIDQSLAYEVWKMAFPEEDAMANAFDDRLEQFRVLALGVYGAGRNLTPDTFGDGLMSACGPCPRASDTDPLITFVDSAGALSPAGRTGDFAVGPWDAAMENPYNRDAETGEYLLGYWNFEDGGVRHVDEYVAPAG